jgi:hypothetical protein
VEKQEMNNPLVKVGLVGLLLLLVTAPFAGLAPLMLILLGLGVFWALGSLVQAFFTADVEGDSDKA